MTVPVDIRDALLRQAKVWMLERYVGGKRKLRQWDDTYASLTKIQSNSLPGDRRKNLRRLVKLASDGLLVEIPRSYRGQMRSFTLPRKQLDEVGREAVRQLESQGYVVDKMMDEIPANKPEGGRE